jgi:hypothetical protein
MAQPPLLIIYQWTVQHKAILRLQLVQVADWLRLILQAEQKSRLLLSHYPLSL